MWLRVNLFLPLQKLQRLPTELGAHQEQPHALCTGDDPPQASFLTMELTSLATATRACHGPQPPPSRSNVSAGMEAVVGGGMGQKVVGKTQPGTELRTLPILY